MFLGMCNRNGNVGKMSVMIQCRAAEISHNQSGNIAWSLFININSPPCNYQVHCFVIHRTLLDGYRLPDTVGERMIWWIFCSESLIKKNKAEIKKKKPAMGSWCILNPVRVRIREEVGMGCPCIWEPNSYVTCSIKLFIHPKYNHRTCIHIGFKIQNK